MRHASSQIVEDFPTQLGQAQTLELLESGAVAVEPCCT